MGRDLPVVERVKSVAAQIMAFVLIVAALAFVFTKLWPSDLDLTIAAQRDTVRITDTVIAVRTDTLRVRLAAKARTDTLVQVVNDTVVQVRDSLVTVPAEIPERIRACDCALQAALDVIAADSAGLRALRNLNVSLTKKADRRFGLAVTYGPSCNTSGCDLRVTLGASYRIR